MLIPVEVLARQVAWLLLGAAAVGIVTRWLRVPYAVALVLAGLVASLVATGNAVAVPHLEPQIVLFAFLPPLLFDAAFRLDEREVRTVFPPIVLLALPGVAITAVVVGVLVALGLHLPPISGLLFGSIVAATDPVAVTAVFRQLRVHHRLATIVEAESLVNDGTAITLYTALLAAAGVPVAHSASPIDGITEAIASRISTTLPSAAGALLAALVRAIDTFGWEVGGGVIVGAAAGMLFSQITATVDDHLVEMTLSTALAYGSYLAADSIGASGALACVVAGFIHGSYGRRIGMSQNTRELLDALWEYLGFLANGLLFLLVGLSIEVPRLLNGLWAVGLAVLAVTLARLLVVELSTRLVPAERSLASTSGRLVLAWGGLRGALTLALAHALPDNFPGRDVIVTMSIGVVLFTLLAQGATLPLVIRLTGLTRREAA